MRPARAPDYSAASGSARAEIRKGVADALPVAGGMLPRGRAEKTGMRDTQHANSLDDSFDNDSPTLVNAARTATKLAGIDVPQSRADAADEEENKGNNVDADDVFL